MTECPLLMFCEDHILGITILIISLSFLVYYTIKSNRIIDKIHASDETDFRKLKEMLKK